MTATAARPKTPVVVTAFVNAAVWVLPFISISSSVS